MQKNIYVHCTCPISHHLEEDEKKHSIERSKLNENNAREREGERDLISNEVKIKNSLYPVQD